MVKSCSSCGHEVLEPGFIEDDGEASQGYARWIPGELETGMFGGAKRYGKKRFRVDAYRCGKCSHLELFAGELF